jgi:hypothetical protein
MRYDARKMSPRAGTSFVTSESFIEEGSFCFPKACHSIDLVCMLGIGVRRSWIHQLESFKDSTNMVQKF